MLDHTKLFQFFVMLIGAWIAVGKGIAALFGEDSNRGIFGMVMIIKL